MTARTKRTLGASKENLKRAAKRMAAEQGISQKEATNWITQKQEDLALLLMLHEYLGWAQETSELDDTALPDELEAALSEFKWHNKKPFVGVKLSTWYNLADRDMFNRFAEVTSLRSGTELEDVIVLPSTTWKLILKYRRR